MLQWNGEINRSVRAFQRQPSLARLVATLETSADPFATEILARLAQTTNDIYLEALHDVVRAVPRNRAERRRAARDHQHRSQQQASRRRRKRSRRR